MMMMMMNVIVIIILNVINVLNHKTQVYLGATRFSLCFNKYVHEGSYIILIRISEMNNNCWR